MSKSLEQTFLQRIFTNGPEAHAKMPDIAGHKGNANQNHGAEPFYTHEDGSMILFKRKKDQGHEAVRTLTLLVGIENCCGNQFGVFPTTVNTI